MLFHCGGQWYNHICKDVGYNYLVTVFTHLFCKCIIANYIAR